MAERAADGAAIAGLAMADMLERLVNHRKGLRHVGGELDVTLARHRAEAAGAVLDIDVREPSHAIEIDQMIGSDDSKIEHRHQGLPARKRHGVVEPADEVGSFVDRGRIMIGEGRRLHCLLSIKTN